MASFPNIALTSLEPQFMGYETKREIGTFHKDDGRKCQSNPLINHTPDCWYQKEHDAVYLPYIDKIEDALGVDFLCPKCLHLNGGKHEGVHRVLCWTPKVPAEATPKPGRWTMSGTGYSDLTLTASSSSILLTSEGGCKAHFFIENGMVRDA